jgi:di/tricarboxylate transporter
MGWEFYIVAALTVGTVIAFVAEAARIDAIALSVMGLLMVSGIVTPTEGLSGLSNPATVTIAAMFVLSESLRRTGFVNIVGERLGELYASSSYLTAQLTMMTGVAVVSAFINNTAVVAIMMPMVLGASREADLRATEILMPLSFASMFGGVCTVIGTSTNILVSSLIVDHGMAPIGMFEMAGLGVILTGTGLVYLLTVGQRLLPSKGDDESAAPARFHQFSTEIEVAPASEAAYRPLRETPLGEYESVEVVEVRRDAETFEAPDGDLVIRPGDIVRMSGPAQALGRIGTRRGMEIRPEVAAPDLELGSNDYELMEAVVVPRSELDGMEIDESTFGERLRANILAIRRSREIVTEALDQRELRGGDVLLLQVARTEVDHLKRHPALVMLSEVGLLDFRREKMIPMLLILASVVLLAAFGVMPIVVSAVAGCLAAVGLGAVDLGEAYDAVDWQVIFLLAGIIPLGTAIEKTGGVALLAEVMLGGLGALGPFVVLGSLYLAAGVLTAVMSNQATAVLLTPLAVELAAHLSLNPRPFALAVAFAASTSFMTPVGYQTNTLVYGAGDYRFVDFLKVGTPLTILFGVISVLLIPFLWPLQG